MVAPNEQDERTVIVTVALPAADHEALSRFAKAAGRSRRKQAAQFIRDSLRREIAGGGKAQPEMSSACVPVGR